MLTRYSLNKMRIRLRAIFMKKKLRHRYRRIAMVLLPYRLATICKWGVSYSVFDNEEMLEHSIKHIRDHVNYVNVVYQLESWYGNPASENLLSTLNDLKEKGLIDELIEYKADTSIDAGIQERKKRNIGLEYAKKRGIDYFMTMDCDEFYIGREVEKAKYFIVKNGITHSFVDIFNYAQPTKRYLSPTVSYVLFFSKIKNGSFLIHRNKHSIALVDPTRMLNHYLGAKYYFLHSIAMHHMTSYRKCIFKKIQNSTAREAYKNFKMSEKNCVKVEDIFHLEGCFDDK